MKKKLNQIKIPEGYAKTVQGDSFFVETNALNAKKAEKILLGEDSQKRTKLQKDLNSREFVERLFQSVYSSCTCGSTNFKLVIISDEFSFICPKCKLCVVSGEIVQEMKINLNLNKNIMSIIKSDYENRKRMES
jgi:hypothetical protein